MKFLFMMLCSFSLLLAEGLNQKLIVYSDTNEKNAQENLLKLKIHFIENPHIRTLNEANDLNVELETLGSYTMVIVKPIASLSVKNILLMELAPVFPDVFALEDATQSSSEAVSTAKKSDFKTNTVGTFMETIGLQWIALLILAAVGLLLSFLRRKKLLSLDKKQKALDTDQKEIEIEIKKLGKYDA